MIPALKNAEFLRYGVMHRNSFIDSPRHLSACFEIRTAPGLFFAGQITGVEGYIESAASGLTAGINAATRHSGRDPVPFPPETAMGTLASYISNPATMDFQPMNINFGIFPPLTETVAKKEKKAALTQRALEYLSLEMSRKERL